MNQKKAKSIRRKVYGDNSQRVRQQTGYPTVRNIGLRAEYLAAKKIAK